MCVCVVQSQAPVQSIQLAVNILRDVLQYSTQLAELAREVGLNSILGILTSLLGLKTEVRAQGQTNGHSLTTSSQDVQRALQPGLHNELNLEELQ